MLNKSIYMRNNGGRGRFFSNPHPSQELLCYCNWQQWVLSLRHVGAEKRLTASILLTKIVVTILMILPNPILKIPKVSCVWTLNLISIPHVYYFEKYHELLLCFHTYHYILDDYIWSILVKPRNKDSKHSLRKSKLLKCT
jgi:hypothetical protein